MYSPKRMYLQHATKFLDNVGKVKATEAVEMTNSLYESFCEQGGWEWAHVLLHALATPLHSSDSCRQLHTNGEELLEGVRRMVYSNEQAYEELTPHLYSCAGLAGAFVDAVSVLESNRKEAIQ